MQTGLTLVEHLKQHGFERKVYTDQDGQPVFFSRVFTTEECPVFMETLVSDFAAAPDEIDPGTVTVEISEAGDLLQFSCSEFDYWASCDPNTDAEGANSLLKEFGIQMP